MVRHCSMDIWRITYVTSWKEACKRRCQIVRNPIFFRFILIFMDIIDFLVNITKGSDIITSSFIAKASDLLGDGWLLWYYRCNHTFLIQWLLPVSRKTFFPSFYIYQIRISSPIIMLFMYFGLCIRMILMSMSMLACVHDSIIIISIDEVLLQNLEEMVLLYHRYNNISIHYIVLPVWEVYCKAGLTDNKL